MMRRLFAAGALFAVIMALPGLSEAQCEYEYETLYNPVWEVDLTDAGYSDWVTGPGGHDLLSGEWGAAISYDGITGGEAMWLQNFWWCPDWWTNSRFYPIEHMAVWDDPGNPVEGDDTGMSLITNNTVQINISASMEDGYTVMGLQPGVADPSRVTAYRYVLLQTYTIRNITDATITNVNFYQFMHAHPNDDYGPNNYGVFDPAGYGDPGDDYSDFHYDMTFYAPVDEWLTTNDDVIGFSSALAPTAWQVGSFPSLTESCDDGEPGPESLHHSVEAGVLDGTNFFGPEEIAGTMKWHLGDLAPGEEAAVTVLLSPGRSEVGLPPVEVPSPTDITYTGDSESCEGDTANLSALLTDDQGAPLAGKLLSFSVGNQSAEGTTGADGRVSLPLVLDQVGGSYQAAATFRGDLEYGGSLDTADFLISCGCGTTPIDGDNDGTPDCADSCPDDGGKIEPGLCGCGAADTDSDGDGTPDCIDNPGVALDLDILPPFCPNPINIQDRGVLPAAITGNADFDVSQIDPATIRLAGIAPLMAREEDVTASLSEQADPCECTADGPDGYTDLALKFDNSEVAAAALASGGVGDEIVLTVTGLLRDGTTFSGADCVILKSRATLAGDWNSDGKTDILWRDYVTGENSLWYMDGPALTETAALPPVAASGWVIEAAADFNGDGKPDILWRNRSTGQNFIWYMDGSTYLGGKGLTPVASGDWHIVAAADFDGDGGPDILWRNHATGLNYLWFIVESSPAGSAPLPGLDDVFWRIAGARDYDGDGKADILWRHHLTGANHIWYMDGATPVGSDPVPAVPDTQWSIEGTSDFDLNGKPDIVWRHGTTDNNFLWYMNGAVPAGGELLPR